MEYKKTCSKNHAVTIPETTIMIYGTTWQKMLEQLLYQRGAMLLGILVLKESGNYVTVTIIQEFKN